jgi:hypothetical protein
MIRSMIPAMKWIAAVCALVVTGGLVQAQLASSDSPPGGSASSEQQPPSDLLPGVTELPQEPAVERGRTGMASTARAGHASRYRRSRRHAAFSSRHALHRRFARQHHRRYYHFAGGRRSRFAHYRYHHRHPASYRHSLAHRHRHRRHLVLSPYDAPYIVPASFYGPPGPYYGPPYAPF